MEIRYDKTADALYVYFRKGKVSHTKKITDDVLVDIDAKGKILGLEILDVKQNPQSSFEMRVDLLTVV